LARLPFGRSPEAELCALAFEAARDRLEELLLSCESGLELRARGFEADVLHSARLDRLDAVPVLRERGS
jgi:2-phosphosulfolactate phosphatase